MKDKEIVVNTMKELEKKFGHVPNCPFCNDDSAKWVLPGGLVMSNSYDVETNRENPANAIVSVPLSCDNCGFITNIDPTVHGTLE